MFIRVIPGNDAGSYLPRVGQAARRVRSQSAMTMLYSRP